MRFMSGNDVLTNVFDGASMKKFEKDHAKDSIAPGIIASFVGGLITLSILQTTIGHMASVHDAWSGAAIGIIAAVFQFGMYLPHPYFGACRAWHAARWG